MDKKQPVELTKKQELNNHITATRKFVRQAKVHVIRKLVREVQLLRDRKGSEEAQAKSKRKADRLHSEISVIKALKVDKVTIHALLNTTKLAEVLKNAHSSLEDRALARLSHHPSVNARVTKYREANVNWRLQIPVLLEKTRAAQLKQAEKQLKTAQPKPDKISLTEDDDDDDDDEDDKYSVVNSEDGSNVNSDSGSNDSDSKIDLVPIDKKKNLLKNKKIIKAVEEDTSKTKNIQIKKETSSKSKKEPAITATKIVDLNKIEGTVKVQVIKDWSEFDVDTTSAVSEKTKNSSTTNLSTRKPKSSFFIGGVDEPKDDEDSYFDQERSVSHVTNRGRGKQGRAFTDYHQGNRRSSQPRNNNNNKGSGNWDRSERKQPRYFESKLTHGGGDRLLSVKVPKDASSSRAATVESPANNPNEHLHPSWEAKKRQNLSLEFQGKKIKFDD